MTRRVPFLMSLIECTNDNPCKFGNKRVVTKHTSLLEKLVLRFVLDLPMNVLEAQ